MTRIVSTTTPDEFLAAVTRMLGYTPTKSVVLVPFAGTRSVGAVRADLPSADESAAAATLIGLVCRVRRADGVAIIVFAETAPTTETTAFTSALVSRADACGLRVIDLLHVAADERRASIGGDGPRGDQHGGTELPVLDERHGERVRAMLANDAPLDAVEDLPRFFDTEALKTMVTDQCADAAYEPDAGTDATMIRVLERPALRDIALLTWAGDIADGDAAMEAQLAWEAGSAYPVSLASRMWGEGPQPSPRRLRAALALCRRAAALAPPKPRAGALAACAWLSWALGRMTHAGHYATAARALVPDHGLAGIISDFLDLAHLPAWAFGADAEAVT